MAMHMKSKKSRDIEEKLAIRDKDCHNKFSRLYANIEFCHIILAKVYPVNCIKSWIAGTILHRKQAPIFTFAVKYFIIIIIIIHLEGRRWNTDLMCFCWPCHRVFATKSIHKVLLHNGTSILCIEQ